MVEYPDATGATQGRGNMTVVGGRLHRFDGHDGESCVGGGIEWLDVSGVWRRVESGTTALQSGWAREEITYQEGGAERAWWVLRRSRGESISRRLAERGRCRCRWKCRVRM